jgi:hypothetical protein
MSQINVTTIRNRTGGPPALDKGVVVTGCTTSTTGYFSGNVTIGGTLTHEDVTNIDSVGVVTARGGFLAGNPAVSIGATITAAGAASFSGITTVSNNLFVGAGVSVYSSTGIVSATAFYGDGAALSGVVSGIEVESGGTSVGTSLTAINFASGATVTQGSSGITTVTIAAGITTATTGNPSGITSTLYLDDAQDHKVNVTGFVTFTTSGGSEGGSHTLRITNVGVATVGFSTYFLWPSGSVPSMPTTSGAISLISFTVQRVGAGGTQLLAGASLNYS